MFNWGKWKKKRKSAAEKKAMEFRNIKYKIQSIQLLRIYNNRNNNNNFFKEEILWMLMILI